MKPKIAIIVPTIREDRIEAFKKAWAEQFAKYEVRLFVVHDGKRPYVEYIGGSSTKNIGQVLFSVEYIMGKKYKHLIFNRSDVCRNLGFALAKKLDNPDIYISLDDDVLPDGDTIGRHIAALNVQDMTEWVSTLVGRPVRGIPYEVRNVPVYLSHGIWKGVPDLDAPDQLVNGIPAHYLPVIDVIPKGVYFPLCAMNFAFRKEALPYIYQAPMNTHGFDRFGDIWSGIYLKREFDKLGWAVYTGYASVIHQRASNVYANLEKEAKGIRLNEFVWKETDEELIKRDPYFKLYRKCREDWVKFLQTLK